MSGSARWRRSLLISSFDFESALISLYWRSTGKRKKSLQLIHFLLVTEAGRFTIFELFQGLRELLSLGVEDRLEGVPVRLRLREVQPQGRGTLLLGDGHLLVLDHLLRGLEALLGELEELVPVLSLRMLDPRSGELLVQRPLGIGYRCFSSRSRNG
jgi:hypothetical protein